MPRRLKTTAYLGSLLRGCLAFFLIGLGVRQLGAETNSLVLQVFPAIQLQFPTAYNLGYTLQASTNLADWTNADAFLGTGTVFTKNYRTDSTGYRYFRLSSEIPTLPEIPSQLTGGLLRLSYPPHADEAFAFTNSVAGIFEFGVTEFTYTWDPATWKIDATRTDGAHYVIYLSPDPRSFERGTAVVIYNDAAIAHPQIDQATFTLTGLNPAAPPNTASNK